MLGCNRIGCACRQTEVQVVELHSVQADPNDVGLLRGVGGRGPRPQQELVPPNSVVMRAIGPDPYVYRFDRPLPFARATARRGRLRGLCAYNGRRSTEHAKSIHALRATADTRGIQQTSKRHAHEWAREGKQRSETRRAHGQKAAKQGPSSHKAV
eukprot:269313-Prymnesium_polylepis.2